jgi:crotonobetainyl-CoA:carnitine CoA-transferase CaiB-like acyl-CoA transferase
MITRDILTGIRVIELGEDIAVPYCGKLLADFGAEVIKIESPGTGDSTRRHGPFPNDRPHPERSGLFLALNLNKLGITLRPEIPTGRHILGELLQRADVLIHQTAPRDLQARALTPEILRRDHPRLIAASITPYGQSGPYRDYQSADITVCALSGLSEGFGEADHPPLTPPFGQGGYQAGLSTAGAIVMALLTREAHGQGQVIDMSTAEVLATLQTGVYVNNFLFDGSRSMRTSRFGSSTIYPAHFFRCQDGFLWVTAPQWAQWERLLAMIGRPDLATDERFHNRHALATTPPPELEVPLAQWFMAHTRAEIFRLCRAQYLPISPVYNIAELIDHPQLVARGFIMAVEQPGVGTLRLPGLPMHLSKTPWHVRHPAPLLGEHNARIYGQELGYAPQALSALRRTGVI